MATVQDRRLGVGHMQGRTSDLEQETGHATDLGTGDKTGEGMMQEFGLGRRVGQAKGWHEDRTGSGTVHRRGQERRLP